MIPQDTIQKVLSAANITEVVSEFVNLKKKGVNYLGVCPFHNEKTPSMIVSPAKGIFKCFGCGKAGNAISFVMEHEAMTYPEAIEYVAKKYHVEIPKVEMTADELQKRSERDTMFTMNRVAATFYADNLKNHGQAINYLKDREFDLVDLAKFELGSIATAWGGLLEYMSSLGYNPQQLHKAGLLSKSESGKYFDRFRDRVMFPYFDLMGHVVGFTGRILDPNPGKNDSKYLNSPETELFHKGRLLYGLFQAKAAIVKEGKAHLVEGNTDVIRFHKQGLTNTICTSGTALTVEHARLIRRFTSNLTILFDGDMAGLKAAVKGIDICIAEGLNVYVALLPAGEDPDTFAKGKSRDELYRWIEDNEKDFILLMCDLAAKDIEQKPAEKGKLINELLDTVKKVPDLVTRETYFSEVTNKFGIDRKKVEAGIFKEEKADELFGMIVNETAIREKDQVFIYASKETAFANTGSDLETNSIVISGLLTAVQIGKLSGITKNLVFAEEFDYEHSTSCRAGLEVFPEELIKIQRQVKQMKFLVENGFTVSLNCGDRYGNDQEYVSFSTFYFDYLAESIKPYDPDSKKEAVEAAAEFLSKLDNTTISIKTAEIAKRFGLSKADFAQVLKPFLSKVKNKVQQRNEEIMIDDEHYVFSIEKLPDYVDQKFFNKYNHFAAQNKDGKKIFYVFATEHGTLTKVGNFYMEPQFQVFSDDPLKNKRICKLNHADLRSSKYVEIPSNEMIEFGAFKKFLFRQGPYLLRNAKVFHLDTILDSIALQFPVAYELTIFGQQNEDFYAFSNAVFAENKIKYMDDLGLIEHENTTFYSPSISVIYKDVRKDEDQFALDRFFIYRENKNVHFKEWAALVREVYKYNDNGCWTVLMAIMCAFRSDIFKIDRLFTTLFFIGPTECGKSQLAQSIRALYIHPDAPMFNLNSGTDAAFFTMLQRYRDAPVVMEEYNDQQISDIKFQGLKASIYDGEGKTKRQGAQGTALDVSQVNAVPILLGQEAPERDDASLANRCVLCPVPKKELWSDNEIANFQLLKRWEKEGLTEILVEVLKCRPIVRDHYQNKLRIVQKELRKDLTDDHSVFQTRVLNTVSLFLAMVKLFEEHVPGLELPFTYKEFYQIARKKLIHQSESITSSNRLAVFFDTFVQLTEDTRNGLIRGKEYKIELLDEITVREGQKNSSVKVFDEGPKKVLFVRLEVIHPKYRDRVGIQEHLKMNNLQNYLKDHPAYLGAIKHTWFNWQNEVRSIADDGSGRVISTMFEESKRTSAIALDYEKLGIDLGSSNQMEIAKPLTPEQQTVKQQLSMYPEGTDKDGKNLPF